MAISSEIQSPHTIQRSPLRYGRGFLVEALVVLAFLMLALAVFTRLFSSALFEARDATQLSHAVQIATTYAEVFAADPATTPREAKQEGFVVSCDVRPAASTPGAGTLYEATITVAREDGEDVYELVTARYVSEQGTGEQGAGDGR